MRPFRLIMILVIGVSFQSAYARLGESSANIGDDQLALNAKTHSEVKHDVFTDHELSGAINTVHEYENAQGVVFAVTWHGVKIPDLSNLLGTNYDEYHALDAARPRMLTRATVSIKTSNVVVIKGGHMRDVRGQAYVPALVPAGVRVENLP